MARKVLVELMMTLDGVAEFPVDPEPNPNPNAAQETREFWEAMWTGHWRDIDTLLLGGRTYEKWADFWPGHVDSADEHMREFARFSTRVEKVVFSRTLRSADWSNSRIVRGPMPDEISRLRSLPGKNMVVGGGPRLIQSVIAQDLADELYLMVFSNIVGRGKPAFHVETDPDHDEDRIPWGAPGRHNYRLLEARGIGADSLFLHYELDPSTRTAGASTADPRPRKARGGARSSPSEK